VPQQQLTQDEITDILFDDSEKGVSEKRFKELWLADLPGQPGVHYRDRFEWSEHCYKLASKYHTSFVVWWSPIKFDWDNCSYQLAHYCRDYFHRWWNSDRFNYGRGSEPLAETCYEYCVEWFDSQKFNWESVGGFLPAACGRRLAKRFDEWFDKETFDYGNGSALLAKYCSEHIAKWYDVDLFNWEYGQLLKEYCSGHHDELWNADYIIKMV